MIQRHHCPSAAQLGLPGMPRRIHSSYCNNKLKWMAPAMTPTVASETPHAISRRRLLERAAAMAEKTATPMNKDGWKPGRPRGAPSCWARLSCTKASGNLALRNNEH